MSDTQASNKTIDEPVPTTDVASQDEAPTGLLPGQHWTQTEPDQDDDDNDSTLSDNASSTASLSSDILRYREINGRRYHSEQGDAQYWSVVISAVMGHGHQVWHVEFNLLSRISNDNQANEALDINHHVLILMYNDKLFKAPLNDNVQVLFDSHSASLEPRIYTDRDFADEFPNAKVIGTDISPIQPGWLPPNLEFQIDDCMQEWTFKENSLDYVHMRFLVGSIIDWPGLFKQAYKCLKPGGYIESHEASPCIGSDDNSVSEDSAMGQWGKIFMEGGRKLQRPFSVLEDNVQVESMNEAGFINIEEEEIKVPIGGWPEDPRLKEAGQYFQAAILQDVEGTLTFIANLLGWSKEEIHVFAARYRREIRSKKVHGYFRGKVVWAQKPLVN
ncbi:hypothetical protein FPRO05_08144 [Fusarium proliferatum]|uniref:Methyltransferase n=1 Tax=Gibberella intermedia TaxID=948311 RepID=A0A365NIN3_GIBIN|nr:hypothetical protein FPRO05_08144 [Fusarium proliferatum]